MMGAGTTTSGETHAVSEKTHSNKEMQIQILNQMTASQKQTLFRILKMIRIRILITIQILTMDRMS